MTAKETMLESRTERRTLILAAAAASVVGVVVIAMIIMISRSSHVGAARAVPAAAVPANIPSDTIAMLDRHGITITLTEDASAFAPSEAMRTRDPTTRSSATRQQLSVSLSLQIAIIAPRVTEGSRPRT